MKNQQFWRVNRCEKDALIVDCYDYDSGSEFVNFLLIEEAYWPKVSKWKLI